MTPPSNRPQGGARCEGAKIIPKSDAINTDYELLEVRALGLGEPGLPPLIDGEGAHPIDAQRGGGVLREALGVLVEA